MDIEPMLFCNDCRGIPMYILGNKSHFNGAVQMMNKRILKIAEKYIGRDFIILPSSIHELVLIPVKDVKNDITDLMQMVKDVNDTLVEVNEILSYHVYRYYSDTEEIKIIA